MFADIATALKPLRRRTAEEWRYLRHIATGRAPSTQSDEQADTEYRNGEWNFLGDQSESPRYSCLVELIATLFPHSKVLDVGCGNGILAGHLLAALPNCTYVGIDHSQEAVRQAQSSQSASGRASFHRVNSAQMYSTNERFNAVIFNESIYYFDRASAVLEQYSKLLTPRGVLIVSIYQNPAKRGMWRELEKNMDVTAERNIMNDTGVKWTIKTLSPKL